MRLRRVAGWRRGSETGGSAVPFPVHRFNADASWRYGWLVGNLRLFRFQNFITFGNVAFSFVFDKFYLIMD
jgi:hypothetical protein